MRLFFAVWPDDRARAGLARLLDRVVAQAGGRPTAPEKIHLTLAFLGDVDPGRVPELERIAAAVRVPPFELRLDRTGAFRRARVAWVGAEHLPPGLLALHGALAAGLEAGEFALEKRPYSPHITLARNTSRPLPKADIDPIDWQVREFALVRSELGAQARYTTLGSWALR